MSDEVTDEEQALMAVKLAENVRKLIRDEVKAALEDKAFIDGIFAYPLSEAVIRSCASSHSFQAAVKSAMIVQLNKF